MVRIHNPVKGDKSKKGADQQYHGGTMETVDQFANAVTQTVQNIGGGKSKKKK